MKLLANENFPVTSVNILRSAGYDIKSIGSDYFGIADSEVMNMAMKEHRLILTFDRDYGELVFKRGLKPEAGIIYFRWNNFTPEEPGEYLLKVFDKKLITFTRRLTVFSENSIRQKSY